MGQTENGILGKLIRIVREQVFASDLVHTNPSLVYLLDFNALYFMTSAPLCNPDFTENGKFPSLIKMEDFFFFQVLQEKAQT